MQDLVSGDGLIEYYTMGYYAHHLLSTQLCVGNMERSCRRISYGHG